MANTTSRFISPFFVGDHGLNKLECHECGDPVRWRATNDPTDDAWVGRCSCATKDGNYRWRARAVSYQVHDRKGD